MKRLFFIFLFLPCFCFGQHPEIKRTWHWYFGDGAGLDFSSGNPVADVNSNLQTIESSAVISDTAGNLLFYTDGDTVWNINHQPMPSGTGLLGCGGVFQNSSTQGVVIVPQPTTSDVFYIFTVDCLDNAGGPDGMNYSIVDMNLDGGLGDVTVKNSLLHAPSTEKLAAIHHCNNEDVWIVSHAKDSSAWFPPGKFYSYLLTGTGLNTTPVISLSGAAIDFSNGFGGPIKFAPDGSKLMCVNFTPDSTWNASLELFDFDDNTGVIYNPMVLSNEMYLYGGSFSPDGSKIYVCGDQNYFNKIYQYDISSGNQATIIASENIINNVDSLGWHNSMQLAPDGKIYMARWSNTNIDSLAVIQNPNNTACNFLFNGVWLNGRTINYGLPSFVESYFTNDTSGCENGISELYDYEEIIIYPNPTTGIFTVQGTATGIQVYDLYGRLVFHTNKREIDMSSYPAGIYLVKAGNIVRKLVKQ